MGKPLTHRPGGIYLSNGKEKLTCIKALIGEENFIVWMNPATKVVESFEREADFIKKIKTTKPVKGIQLSL